MTGKVALRAAPAMLAGAVLAGALLVGPSAPAIARSDVCEAQKPQMRAYLDCLGGTQKASERRLDRAVDGARATIAARSELKQVQRNRWAGLLEEAQGRFVHWRDFECQSLGPYEGGGAERTIGGRVSGIGALEQRLLCLISLNEARIADIEQRYQPPQDWLESHPPVPLAPTPDEPPQPVETAPARAPAMTSVPRVIEITP